MTAIGMIAPDGAYGEVHIGKAGNAIKDGFKLANPGKTVKLQAPDNEIGMVSIEKLPDAINDGFNFVESDWTDYGQAFTQGVATGVGKIADTAVAGATALSGAVLKHTKPPAMSGIEDDGMNEAVSGQLLDTAKDYWKNDKIAKAGSDLLDTGLGHEKGIGITKAAGEFATPMGELKALGLGVKVLTKAGGVAKLPWVAKINKFLETPVTGKNAGTFAGMNAGAEALRSDDPNTGELENITRELGGALLGGLSIPAATSGLKSVKEISQLLLSREKLYESLVKRGNTTLDNEAIDGIKNIGGELNAKTIYKENDVAAYIERVLPNKAYQIAAKNADSKIISSIEESLTKNLGEMPKGTDTESTIRSLTGQSESILQKVKQENKLRNDALYDEAFSYLKPEEYPVASNSVAAAKDVFSKTYAPSTTGTTETGQGVASSAVANIIKNWEGKKVPPQEMVNQMRALKEHQRKAGGGYSELLTSVIEGIEKDIAASSNAEFLKSYKVASKDYATQLVPFVQIDAARALISGEAPNFVYEMMNNPTNRKEVQQALSLAGENGGKLFDAIKRVKSNEVLTEKISYEGQFNSDQFIKLFTKIKPEADIADLIGKKSFDEIKKNHLVLARKMNTIKEQTARINESKVGTVLNKGGAVGSATAVGATAGFAAGGLPGAVVGAVVGAVGKNWLAEGFAKAANNPKVINRLIEAAQQKESKKFVTIIGRVLNGTIGTAKKATEAIAINPATKYQTVNFGAKAMPWLGQSPFDKEEK